MNWISIKDKIPEVNQDVLIWDKNHDCCKITYLLDESYSDDPELKYAWLDHYPFNEVEYWMPLPPAPSKAGL